MKKNLLLFIPIILLLTSCGPDNASNTSIDNLDSTTINAGIKGRFKNSEAYNVYCYRHLVKEEIDPRPMYVSIYPLRVLNYDRPTNGETGMSGFGVYEDLIADGIKEQDFNNYSFQYKIEQTLTLAKDYTYKYNYSIVFGTTNSTICPDMYSIEVDINGTYRYSKIDDDNYYINLSNPLAGQETIYGAYIPNFSFFGQNAKKHSNPDKVVDFALNREINMEEYDWYTRLRDVTVSFNRETPSNNTLKDNLFNSSFLEYVGQYTTY